MLRARPPQIKFMPVETVFYICAAAHLFAWFMYRCFQAEVAKQPKAAPSAAAAGP